MSEWLQKDGGKGSETRFHLGFAIGSENNKTKETSTMNRTFQNMIMAWGTALVFATAMTSAMTAHAATLYLNDLGTTAQINTWSGDVDSMYVEDSVFGYAVDLDGDGLYHNWLRDDAFLDTFWANKTYYAPLYTTVSNPTFNALGSGSTGWAMHGHIGLRLDDDDTWTDDLSGNSKYYTPDTLEVAKSGPEWESLTQFDFRAGIRNMSGTISGRNFEHMPRVGVFSIEGTLSPVGVGERTNILLNDMGTEEQRNQWTVTGGAVPEYSSEPAWDVDMDNLASVVRHRQDGGDTLTMTMRLDAPDGTAFVDPIATAEGMWSDTYGNSTTLSLSRDGVNFDVIAPTGSGDGWYDMVADASGVAGYSTPFTSLWVQIDMIGTTLNADYDAGFRGLVVTSQIPEPATLTILALSCLFLLKRRRA